jgi:hypothetical protein
VLFEIRLLPITRQVRRIRLEACADVSPGKSRSRPLAGYFARTGDVTIRSRDQAVTTRKAEQFRNPYVRNSPIHKRVDPCKLTQYRFDRFWKRNPTNNSFGWGAFSCCARMPGSRGTPAFASSRATMSRAHDFSFRPGGTARRLEIDAVHLTWHGLDGRIAGNCATEPGPDHRHRFAAMRFPVANRGEHVIAKWGVIEISLARTARAANPRKSIARSRNPWAMTWSRHFPY